MFRCIFPIGEEDKTYIMTSGFFLKAELTTLKHPVKWLALNWEYKEWRGRA